MTLHQAKGLQFPVIYASTNERRKIKSLSDKFDDIIDKGKNLDEEKLENSMLDAQGQKIYCL